MERQEAYERYICNKDSVVDRSKAMAILAKDGSEGAKALLSVHDLNLCTLFASPCPRH